MELSKDKYKACLEVIIGEYEWHSSLEMLFEILGVEVDAGVVGEVKEEMRLKREAFWTDNWEDSNGRGVSHRRD
jgi:hypothetical protein